jgi:glycosyltransferase involved in cell wall biosynthesis
MNVLAYVHLRNIYRSTGSGRVARQLVEHLQRQPRTELRILADPGDYGRIVPLVGAPWSEYPYHFTGNETSKQQARWCLWKHPQAEHYWPDAEVVFCTAESYVPTRKARLAVTLHDAAFFETRAHQLQCAVLKQRLKWNLLFRLLSDNADLFHTVSEFSAERLAHFFPSIRSRLRVVHNAVAPRFFEPETEEGRLFLRENDLHQNPFILLPRGLTYRKNAELVLRTWPVIAERHPELRLVVASHCDPGFSERARSQGSSIVLTGFVSDDVLCSLYHAARLVWFPSLYEGFGLPVLEAMACGAPVLASSSSSLPEVAGNASILVSPYRDSEHIEAISALVEDDRRRAELTRKGVARASSFTWTRSAARLHRFFEELL